MQKEVIYARYSSGVQTEQSIEGQVRVITDYAKNNDIQIVDSYIDRATTGTNDNRAAFQKMMKASSKKNWDLVLVYKLDRFSRNKYEMAIHRKTLRNNGIKLVSVTENIPDSPEGVILESVLEGMAEYYSMDLSQKTKRGKQETRLKGNLEGGRPPFGYKVVKINGENKVVVCEEDAAIVRRIFEECLSGKVPAKIAEGLAADGIRNRSGKFFIERNINDMLHNEKYIGVYRSKTGGVFLNICPRIISDSYFELAKRMLVENRRLGYTAREPFILKHKLKCGCCGERMRGTSVTISSGKKYRYYCCANRAKSKELCIRKAINQQDIEQLVVNTIQKVLDTPDGLDLLVDRIYKIHESKSQNNDTLNVLLKEKKRCQESIDNLIGVIEKGIVTDTVKERLSTYEEQLSAINEKIAENGSIVNTQLTKEDVREKLLKVLSATPAQIIRILIKKIVLYTDKLEIYFNYTHNNGPDENSHQAICFYSEKITLENTEGTKNPLGLEVFMLV